MKITNPATGAVIAEVAADNLKTVRAKYELARAAQTKWAAVPIRKRLAILGKFRELLIERQDTLARTLTQEVGKPIRQSRNEVNGLTARIDFFLAETERALRDEKVFADAAGKLEERIAHIPLGVIANISAWNYPYFVGGNVFVPALAAGNAVLYKPSEFATLTASTSPTCSMRRAFREMSSSPSSAMAPRAPRSCGSRWMVCSSPGRTARAQKSPPVPAAA